MIERGAHQRRIDVAIAGSEQLAAEKRIQRLDIAAEAARRFVTVLERQQALDDARNASELVEETVKAVQARVRAAKVPEAEELSHDDRRTCPDILATQLIGEGRELGQIRSLL